MSDGDRRRMVETQLVGRGLRAAAVLDAMRAVPREAFAPPEHAAEAYADGPLSIGEGQTLSQPYIVALMMEAAGLGPGDRVLEVGAGSGYAAAVASRLAGRVFAIERHAALARAAAARLARLGYANVALRTGDGTAGWPEAAPFDAILVSAGAARVPEALKAQLAAGGRLVMPVGEAGAQVLLRLTRQAAGFSTAAYGPVAFVPLVGGAPAG